jgi:hypothetical protein
MYDALMFIMNGLSAVGMAVTHGTDFTKKVVSKASLESFSCNDAIMILAAGWSLYTVDLCGVVAHFSKW